jgi:hypothetical protein
MIMNKVIQQVSGWLVALLVASAAYATDIPETLKPWQAWVLKDNPEIACPFLYNAAEVRRCAWPSQLMIKVDAKQASFEQQWVVYADSWLTLPGNAQLWPVEVSANGVAVPVTMHDAHPSVYLSEGNYKITGQLHWVKPPDALPVAKDSGLIQLIVDGKAVNQINVDENGLLWLEKNASEKNIAAEENKVDVAVFRKINDGIPLIIETKIIFDVSGEDREMVLGQLLLPQFRPLSINSPLPARIEPDGSLRIQLRAGHWVVSMPSRDVARAASLKMVRVDEHWPENEIWSFAENRTLRTVKVEGADSIDPQQTKIPDEWKALPAYLMTEKNSLTIKEEFRGDPQPEQNQLSLQRELWLDFDGEGYTIKDHITGVMNQGWRLSMLPGYELGRATLNGQPQLITHLKNDQTPGIEVRQGDVDLVTLSRHARISDLSAVGWNNNFQQVSATLHLPPAWSLFSATGVDKVVDSWISQWSLWAIFLVLIISVAIGRLYSTKLGLLALAVLLLTFHEQGAPIGLWLNAVLTVAIYKVLPDSGFKKILNYYRGASFVALILLLLPFSVTQIRQGIYPQLEHPWQMVRLEQAAGGMADVSQPAPAAMDNLPKERKEISQMNKMSSSLVDQEVKRKNQQAGYDPDAHIQTGPGEPMWQWNNVSLTWSGPVTAQQSMSLVLWSPMINRAHDFARAILALMLALSLMLSSYGKPSQWRPSFMANIKTALPFLILCMALFHADNSRADFPPQNLLDELKQRLLTPAKCLPECAAISKAHIIIDEKTLAVYLTVDALENVSVPVLSGDASQWMPSSMLVDGKPLGAIAKTNNQLWVALPEGRHNVVLQGSVDALQKFQLSFPATVRNVAVTNQGWQIAGVVGNHIPGGVEFSRINASQTIEDKSKTLLPDTAPTFVRVERTISLDVDWTMTTRVIRIAPEQGVISLRVPVIRGESILSPTIKTENQNVLVNLGANQPVFEWQSRIDKDSELILQAANNSEWVEQWQLIASPLWHVDVEGIAAIKSPDMMQWRPWPDEKITIHVQRPESIKGSTLTIENVHLEYNPGQRESNATLSLQLLSSQGGHYAFDLPENAKLQSVVIDGRNQALPQTEQRVDIPVKPGTQQINVTWQKPEEIKTMMRTPSLIMNNSLSNMDIVLRLPEDRWPLVVGGPAMGPAVLFWGLFVVMMMVAVALGKNKSLPLKTYQWVLLGLGMSTTTWPLMILVIAWFFALNKRAQLNQSISNDRFNLIQVGIIFLSLLALSALFKTVQASLLLSHPDMLITGNGSSAYELRWYQDRVASQLPQGWVISLPMWIYRLMMLCWSLWLTFALMSWVRWGWQCFATHGLWRKSEPKKIVTPQK